MAEEKALRDQVGVLDPEFKAKSEAMLAWVEAELQESEPRVHALRTMREGLRGLLGLTSDQPRPRPHVVVDAFSLRKPRPAILDLMAVEPRTWTLKELMAAMQERGWLDPRLDKGGEEAVRHAADYLARAGHLVKVSPHAWKPGTSERAREESDG